MYEREIVYEYDCGAGGSPGYGDWSAPESGWGPDFDGEIREVRADDPEYPRMLREVLGGAMPERFSCAGDVSLLGEACVMVCGARDASETALDLAYRCGRMIADTGAVLASGYARGVDMAAHRGALESGGNTLALLPYGLMRFRVHRDLRDSFDPDRFLVVSESGPWQVFTPHAAFRRNKVLAALARAVIVVEPGETGGSWYSAERAHHLGKPLYYLEGVRPQVAARMESLGGVRIPVRRGTPEIPPCIFSGNPPGGLRKDDSPPSPL